ASFVTKAHTLGFKVMLHTDLIGVTPGNADYPSVQQWQLKDPGNLQLIGWLWNSPASTPNRFAWIDPASSVYRGLFISRVGAAVTALQPGRAPPGCLSAHVQRLQRTHWGNELPSSRRSRKMRPNDAEN